MTPETSNHRVTERDIDLVAFDYLEQNQSKMDVQKNIWNFSIVCSFVAEVFSFYVQVASLCFVQREGKLKQNLTTG